MLSKETPFFFFFSQMHLLILFTYCACAASAANILVMMPMPYFSHTNNYMGLFKELAKRGHNMTVVSPFPQKKPLPNWTDLVVTNKLEELMTADENDMTEETSLWNDLTGLWTFFLPSFKTVVVEETVQWIANDTGSSFDLIITETFFGQESYLAFGYKYKAPVVALCALGVNPYINYWMGNHFPTSYLPDWRLLMTDNMNFIERTKNTFFYIWENYGSQIYYLPKMDSLMRKHFTFPGSNDLPYISDMMSNISLALVESHLGLHYPRPLHNNLVEVGGIHLLRDAEKLPEDLQKFMDESPNGVIYFSLGSYMKTVNLKPEIKSAIISTFAQLKQNVLLKYEDDELPDKPKNIKIGKWFPQASILAHPNCKLFVTHCGVHGTMEGLFNGVPLVGIPLFADQNFNIKFVEKIGAGIALDLRTLTQEIFSNAVTTVLTNKTYKESAMKRKLILRDNAMSAMEKAVYWVEYVIRHKGAPHLRPASHDLYWFQYYLLDVMLFFLLCLVVSTTVCAFVVWTVMKIVLKCVWGTRKDNANLKKKTKNE